MTVIAWDGKSLAADRQATLGGNAFFQIKKIKKIGNLLCAFTGEAKYAESLFIWVEDGMVKERFPNMPNNDQVRLIVISESEISEYLSSTNRVIRPIQHIAAFGSGAEFAIGAMSAGVDAKKAVEIACEYDVYCGGGVDVVTLGDTDD